MQDRGPARQAGLSASVEPRPDKVENSRRPRRGSQTDIEAGSTGFKPVSSVAQDLLLSLIEWGDSVESNFAPREE